MSIKYILFTLASIIIAIWCWCSYNSGTGGPLGSFKKRTILGICVVMSVLAMTFINVALGKIWKEAILETINNIGFAFIVAFFLFIFKNNLFGKHNKKHTDQ